MQVGGLIRSRKRGRRRLRIRETGKGKKMPFVRHVVPETDERQRKRRIGLDRAKVTGFVNLVFLRCKKKSATQAPTLGDAIDQSGGRKMRFRGKEIRVEGEPQGRGGKELREKGGGENKLNFPSLGMLNADLGS